MGGKRSLDESPKINRNGQPIASKQEMQGGRCAYLVSLEIRMKRWFHSNVQSQTFELFLEVCIAIDASQSRILHETPFYGLESCPFER